MMQKQRTTGQGEMTASPLTTERFMAMVEAEHRPLGEEDGVAANVNSGSASSNEASLSEEESED